MNLSASNSNRRKTLSISRTKGEWKFINDKIKASGKKNLTEYIQREALNLKKRHIECPNCICCAEGEIQEKRPYLDERVYEELYIISLKMKIPVSKVIDRFIITPLLLPD